MSFSITIGVSVYLYDLERSIKSKIEITNFLGNPDYPSICFGGYRHASRTLEPTKEELKEDLRILSAIGIRVLRTYHASEFQEATNLLQAIRELQTENSAFKMYVMLGAWIECDGAWGESPNHEVGNELKNTDEVNRAVELAQKYPEIVKVIAVGNESMVHWAESYYVKPAVVLKWVKFVQDLKKKGELPSDLKVTSSDNFASWGGGDESYHCQDLTELINAVDYVSMHTYPFHDTHYNPDFWYPYTLEKIGEIESIELAMKRASDYAHNQFLATKKFVQQVKPNTEVHIGETGWASVSNGYYGPDGSRASDEFKQKLYFDLVKQWSKEEGISCFFFEAFDEPWKDASNVNGSENHFGLIDISGNAKYIIWNEVDQGKLEGLSRGGFKIKKTYGGSVDSLLADVLPPISVNN